MHLLEIRCTHFRCLESIVWRPGRGLNLVRGENAQGKTSLLEAMLYCATSKSHRTTQETDLAAHGSDSFRIEMDVERGDRQVGLGCYWAAGAKRFKINGVAQAKLSELLGKVGVVLFSPEDIELVKGGAGLRRRYLDMEVSQVSQPYLTALQGYRQALRQRNELLRRGARNAEVFLPWEEQLARHADAVVKLRGEFIAELSERAAVKYDAIAQAEGLELRYAPDAEHGAALRDALERGRESDLRRKVTQHGPHRDDVHIFLDGQPARTRASQGQQKSIVLAIKLAEVDLMRDRMGDYPILMLDEVLAELDAKRAERLLAALAPDVQCFMTTTQVDTTPALGDRLFDDFRIAGGQIAPAVRSER